MLFKGLREDRTQNGEFPEGSYQHLGQPTDFHLWFYPVKETV